MTYTLTTFGCAEYLRHRGYTYEGELEFLPVKPARPRVSEIQNRVATYYRLRPSDMVSARRSREVARPRQVAMWLARHHTLRSLPEIGKLFGGRDHTTVIHAIRKIDELRQFDADLDADVATLSREFA